MGLFFFKHQMLKSESSYYFKDTLIHFSLFLLTSLTAVSILNRNMVNIFPQQASAFHASYSDSGLFGVYTISQADSARDVSQIYIPVTQCCLPHYKIAV